MSMQLVLSVDPSTDGKALADWFRWCWLGADGSPQVDSAASGDREPRNYRFGYGVLDENLNFIADAGAANVADVLRSALRGVPLKTLPTA